MVQNAERLVGPPKPEAVNIARGICVAPVPIADITSQIRAGIPISQINFSEALLIRKSSKSKVSSGLVMPVGGNLQKNETSLEGALREVGEEVTFVSLDEKSVRTYPNFVYRIPGYDKRRNMEFLFHPVQSKDVSLHTAREGFNGGEDKIAEVLSFSRDELRELTEKGSIQRNDEEIKAASHFTFADTEPQIEEQRGGLREAWRRSKLRLVNGLRTGHFTIADAEPIMSEQDHDKKVEALNGINRDFERFEGRLKKSTLSAVNRLRRIKGEERLTTLDDCSIDEIEVGFIAAQMHMAFADSKKRERTDGAYPPAKADLLKVIPYFAALPPSRMPDLLLLAPTKEITNGLETLEKGFDSGVGVIIEGLELDNVQRSVLSDMSSIDALKFVWLEFRSLDLSDRISLLRQAERATIEGFIDDDAGIVESDVLDAKKTMDEFHDFITSELQSQASLDIPIFQEHRPMDDILNAGIFTHMVYSLGLHPHANIEPNVGDPSSADILQFEALRNLAVFSVGLEAAKMLRGASNDTFQASMDDFFELPSDREVIDLGDGRIHNVYHRVDPDSGMHLIKDERVKKTINSLVRKLFQGPPSESNDIFSINFVIADDNFEGSQDPIEDRLLASEQFREQLLAHIREALNVPDDNVKILEDTHKTSSLDRVRKVAAGEEIEEEFGGTRAGSVGDAIIRDKFILSITDNSGETQTTEICLYPVQTSVMEDVQELGEAGLWGFAEKLSDDYEGNYKARRILKRSGKHPTAQSLYELLYPARIFPVLADRVRGEHVTKKRAA